MNGLNYISQCFPMSAFARIIDINEDISFPPSKKEEEKEKEHGLAVASEVQIAESNYGECSDCGQDIAYQHPLGQLVAKRCVRCQNIYERLCSSSGNFKYAHALA